MHKIVYTVWTVSYFKRLTGSTLLDIMFIKSFQYCIFVFLLNYSDSKNSSIKAQKAIGILAKQTYIAFKNLLSKCEYVPEEIKSGGKILLNIKKAICFDFLILYEALQCGKYQGKTQISNESRILIWDSDANIVDFVSKKKPHSKHQMKIDKITNLIIYEHDIGESTCSNRIRKLIRLAYEKEPKSLIISLDHSSIVSFFCKN